MFLLQQVKRNVIITNKNGKYELTDELPNDVRRKENLKTPWNYSLLPSLLPKMKILAKNYLKLDTERFPYCTANHAWFLFGILG